MARARRAGRSRFPHGAVQPRPSRPPRPLRRHARRPRLLHDGRESRFRIADPPRSRVPIAPALARHASAASATCPFAPGTFGSAAGLLALVAAAGVARSCRPSRSSRCSSLGSLERQRRGAAFRPHRSRPGRDRRSDGHADHAVPESRRLERRVRRLPAVSRWPTSSSRIRRTASNSCTAASASWPTTAMAAVYANLALRVTLALGHRVIW